MALCGVAVAALSNRRAAHYAVAEEASSMYAHASGFNWDEGLMVLAPIGLVAGLLVWARRREGRPGPANPEERNRR